MEILVLIMLALFLIIVAVAIIIYVVVRKSVVENKFNNINDSDFDDEEDDDDINMNIVMPSKFQNRDSITNFNISTNIINEQVDHETENSDLIKKETSLDERIVPIVNDNLNKKEKTNNDLVNKDFSSFQKVELTNKSTSIKEEKDVKYDYVINVLINKKNYIFLANGNSVNKNDRIKLLLDGKIYYGIVTKANYQRDISLLKVKPRKLNIIKIMNRLENISVNANDIEFVPIKKNNI